MRSFLSFIFLLLTLVPPAFAQAPIEDLTFADAEQEARYDKLIDELRCPKCLNANLAGSDAPIAANLRAEIREQLAEGRSDDEILDFMTARYGDFVLYRPRLTSGTAILWFGPLFLLIAGFFIVRRMFVTARSAGSEDALSSDEMRKLQSLLNDKDPQ